jgi:hypothetical protein
MPRTRTPKRTDVRHSGRHARGLLVREIQPFLAEMYAVDVSPDFTRRLA